MIVHAISFARQTKLDVPFPKIDLVSFRFVPFHCIPIRPARLCFFSVCFDFFTLFYLLSIMFLQWHRSYLVHYSFKSAKFKLLFLKCRTVVRYEEIKSCQNGLKNSKIKYSVFFKCRITRFVLHVLSNN